MRIGILTGGGDVPGLNPCIKAVVSNALERDWQVLGIRRGWAGLLELDPEEPGSVATNTLELHKYNTRTIDRTGGTFLHSSRTNPGNVRSNGEVLDCTPKVLHNIERLGLDLLIPIGGDDTLSYGERLSREGVPVIAIPKTMDNDVHGTDYCIGFSTCVTRTIELTHRLRTSAGSHERFLVIEVFGRYAGFTALLPTMAGAADRCV